MEKQNNSNETQGRSILDIMFLSNGIGEIKTLERLGINIKKPLKVDASKLCQTDSYKDFYTHLGKVLEVN